MTSEERSAGTRARVLTEERPIGGWKWLVGRLVVPVAALGRDRRAMMRMVDTLSVVERVLIVVPFDLDRRRDVLRQLFGFKAEFPRWRFDVLLLGGEAPAEDGFKGIGVVQGGRSDLTALGLPGRGLLERLKSPQYGLVIDLSLDPHPLVPYLLNRAQIPLRMGVNSSGTLRARLYNLLVRLQGGEDLLGRLAQTLAPFCRTGEA